MVFLFPYNSDIYIAKPGLIIKKKELSKILLIKTTNI